VNGGGTSTLSPRTLLTERLTRVAEDAVTYRVTVHDPVTWVLPWTLEFPLRRDSKHTLFEFACHEGNYSLRNILSAELAQRAGK
jgi:hypothetical protein